MRHNTTHIERTPLFQWSKNAVTPMSNPIPNANAPAKIVGTNMPVMFVLN